MRVLLLFLPLLSFAAECFPVKDSQLVAFFSEQLRLECRATRARYLADWIASPKARRALSRLRNAKPGEFPRTRLALQQRRVSILEARHWFDGPETVRLPQLAAMKPDGILLEWTGAAEWRGSYRIHPVCRSKRERSEVRWYAAQCGERLCFAGFFPHGGARGDSKSPWTGDCFELFLALPEREEYCEFIVSPGLGLVAAGRFRYSGKGEPIRMAGVPVRRCDVAGAARKLRRGFVAELSVPAEPFRLPDGTFLFMLVRCDEMEFTQWGPVVHAGEGHNIFEFIRGIPVAPNASPAQFVRPRQGKRFCVAPEKTD